MSFLNPMALILLLSVPLLVLLYFLKLKRPQVRVASTLLWQKVIEDIRVNSPFQKLRRSLLLLLQLLALLAIIFALARPTFDVQDQTRNSLIVLLDTSASMSARSEDGADSRLEEAKAVVETLIKQLRRDEELMIITFNARADMAAGFTTNKRQLRETLAAVQATECPTHLVSALALARSVAAARENPRILVISDGACEPLEHVEMPFDVEFLAVGSEAPNVAIAGLDIRRAMHDPSKVEMFVSVQNFSETPFTGNMQVQLNGNVLDSKFVEVGGEETLSQIFEATLREGGELVVSLDVDDALAADNKAWRIIPQPKQRRVLLVGEDLYFLERALRVSPGIAVNAIRPGEYGPHQLDGVSAVIWSRVSAPGIAPCDNVYFDCVPDVEALVLGDVINAPNIVDWDTSHALTRFLDFSNLVLSDAKQLDLPPDADVVLRGARTPLIAVTGHAQGALCIVGFDPLRSNWPLLVSFPLFLNNVFNHFDDLRTRKMRSNVQTGRPLTATWDSGRPSVILPGGERRAMEGVPGRYSFAQTDLSGIYTLDSGEDERETAAVAVNLFDRNESRLAVAETLTVGRKAALTFEIRKEVRREYWREAVLALLILLVIEWIVYHRRLFS